MRGWALGLGVAVLLVIGLAAITITLLVSPPTTVFELEVGDCFDLPIAADEVALDQVELLDCAEPHEAEVVLTGNLNADGDAAYPPDDELFAMVDERCNEVSRASIDGFGLLPVAPDEGAWNGLGGRFLCVALPFGGGTVTGSLVADAPDPTGA